ncbi:hypothetical protein ACFL04_02225 [Patescibacteria group bacterium]
MNQTNFKQETSWHKLLADLFLASLLIAFIIITFDKLVPGIFIDKLPMTLFFGLPVILAIPLMIIKSDQQKINNKLLVTIFLIFGIIMIITIPTTLIVKIIFTLIVTMLAVGLYIITSNKNNFNQYNR